MIYKYYKKEGETMGQMLTRFRVQYGLAESDKLTYAGRLDPLASGEVLILSGDDVHKKDDFNKHDKLYNFTIMFGVATDTNDVLGVINKIDLGSKFFKTGASNLDENKIIKACKSFVKTYDQKYPKYSSYNIDGVPMWSLERDGKLGQKIAGNFLTRLFTKKIKPPTNRVTIYNLEVAKIYTKNAEQILTEARAKVDSVEGDFRQGWILNGWGGLLESNKNQQFIFADVRTTVSSGTYIRTLCADIAKKLGTVAIAYRIEREAIL